MSDELDRARNKLNVPIECTGCGGLFTLLGPDDMSDLCECDAVWRLYVSDAGEYAPVLDHVLTQLAWDEIVRDDLSED